MFNSNRDYSNRVKALKKAGILDSSYSLNKKLSAGQKSNVTRQYNKFKELFVNPDNFVIKDVSRTTGAKMKDSGIETVKIGKKVRAFLRVDPGTRVTVKKGRAIYEKPNGDSFVDKFSRSTDLLGDLEKETKKKLADGEYLTIRIGKGAAAKGVKFTNINTLMKYVTAKNTGGKMGKKTIQKWNDPDAINHIRIIRVSKENLYRESAEKNAQKRKGKT